MPSQLVISLGQHSDAGRKPLNQDFHGACIPTDAQLASKGIAIALADGISSSEVSHIASETAVASFSLGLLLHLRCLVGETVGAARAGGSQLLVARADPPRPLPL